MSAIANPPRRVIHRHVPWAEFIYNALLGAVFVGAAIWLYQTGADWPFSLIPLAGTLFFAVRFVRIRTLILIATESELSVIRRPLLRQLGSFEIIPAGEIRRLRYSLQVHEKRDDDGAAYHVDHFCLDVITRDSQIIKVIDSETFELPRKTFAAMAELLQVPYEESLDRPR